MFRLHLLASRFQTGKQLGGLLTQGRNGSLEFAFAFSDVLVDRSLVLEIIRNRVDLRKMQRWE